MSNGTELEKLASICNSKDVVKFNRELIAELNLELVEVLEVGLKFMDDFKQDIEPATDLNYITSMHMHFFLAGYLMATHAYNATFSDELKNKLN